MELTEWSITVGRVRTSHGLAGMLKVQPLCDDPDRFHELEELCVVFENGRREMAKLAHVAYDGHDLRVSFEGVDSKAAAVRYRHALLMIKPEMRRALDDDSFYVDDLVGLRVKTTDGRDLGTIREVLLLPANDVYVTELVLVPALREVVRSVDLEAGIMEIEPPDGLAPEIGL